LQFHWLIFGATGCNLFSKFKISVPALSEDSQFIFGAQIGALPTAQGLQRHFRHNGTAMEQDYQVIN
jgi:hypothetical protein